MNRLAKIISCVFHPVFMTFWLFLYFFIYGAMRLHNIPVFNVFLLATLFFTTLMPVAAIVMCRTFNVISSFDMPERKDRYIAYCASLISYVFFLVYILLVFKLNPDNVFPLIIIGSIIALLGVVIINFFWKISIHMCSAGALLGAFFMISFYIKDVFFTEMIASVAIAAVVGWARMQLNAHTLSQLLCGWLLGLCSQLLCFSCVFFFIL